MATMTMVQAIRSAMDVMLERDNNVVVFSAKTVGYFGGVFRCTEGLQAKYGHVARFDTPILRGGIVGIVRSAWARNACGRWPRFSSPITFIRPRPAGVRTDACAIALAGDSRLRSSCGCPPAVASTGDKLIARVPRHCSRM